jgi:hypothetical protein
MQNIELIPPKELQTIAGYVGEVKNLSAALIQLAKDAAAVKFNTPTSGTGSGTGSTPRQKPDQQVNALEKELNRIYDEQARVMTRMTAEVRQLTKEKAILKEQERQSSAEMKLAAKESLATANSMDALRVKISQLAKVWASLDMDSPEFAQAGKDLAELRAKVTAAEMSVGQFGRNVGNYASGFSPLSFQVQQIARELPSLAHSLPQFFLAISNNLPMFADELKRARTELATLQAQGQKGIPVWKQLATSIFSWQTAMTVAITMLVLNGKHIAEWAGNVLKGRDAALDAEGAMRKVNDALEVSDFGKKIANFERLRNLYAEIGDNAKEKEKFLKDYREEIDATGVSVRNLVDADNLFITNSAAYIEAIKLRTQANAAQGLAEKEYSKQFEAQVKADEKIAKRGLQARFDYFNSLPADTVIPAGEDIGINFAESLSPFAHDALNSRRAGDIAEFFAGVIGRIRETEFAAMHAGEAFNDLFANLDTQAQSILTGVGLTELINGDTDTSTTDNTRRERERRRKLMADIASDNRKAQDKLAEDNLDMWAQSNKEIADDETQSLLVRTVALREYYDTQKKLAREAATNQRENIIQGAIDKAGVDDKGNPLLSRLEAEQAVAPQIEALRMALGIKLNGYDVDFAEQSLKIEDDAIQKAIEAQKRAAVERENQMTLDESNELTALSKAYKNRELSQKEYEEEQLRIQRKYAVKRADAELKAMEDQLKELRKDKNVSPEQAERILALEAEIAKKRVDIAVAANGIIRQDNEKALSDWEDYTKETFRAIIDAARELIGVIGELSQIGTDKELAELEKRREAAEKHAEDEQDRIERLAEEGAISEEQKNARIALSEQKLAEQQKIIDAQRVEAEKRQARFNVAISTAQAIMSAALTQPFIPAGLIAMGVAATAGAVQLAAVNAAQYATGTPEGGHPGGLAWIGDGGRSEMVIAGGRMFKSPAVPTLVDLPRGAEVLPDYTTALRDMQIAAALTTIRQSDTTPTKVVASLDDKMILARLGDTNSRMHKLIEVQESMHKTIRRQASGRRFKEFKEKSIFKNAN